MRAGALQARRSKCLRRVEPSARDRGSPLKTRSWPIPQTRAWLRETTSMSFTLPNTRLNKNAMLTTREAGELVGRSEAAVRSALCRGVLPGERGRDFWLVRAADVVAWARHTPPGHGRRLARPRTEEVFQLLTEWGSASAEEIATVMSLHVGNVRKFLAILAAEGRAERRDNGQWVLNSSEVSLAC